MSGCPSGRALRGSQRLHQVETTDVLEIVEADVRRRHRQVDDGQKQAVFGGADVLVEVFPRRPPVADRQCLRVGDVLRERESRAAGFGGCVPHEDAQRAKHLGLVLLRDRETHSRHDHLRPETSARTVPRAKSGKQFRGNCITAQGFARSCLRWLASAMHRRARPDMSGVSRSAVK